MKNLNKIQKGSLLASKIIERQKSRNFGDCPAFRWVAKDFLSQVCPHTIQMQKESFEWGKSYMNKYEKNGMLRFSSNEKGFVPARLPEPVMFIDLRKVSKTYKGFFAHQNQKTFAMTCIIVDNDDQCYRMLREREIKIHSLNPMERLLASALGYVCETEQKARLRHQRNLAEKVGYAVSQTILEAETEIKKIDVDIEDATLNVMFKDGLQRKVVDFEDFNFSPKEDGVVADRARTTKLHWVSGHYKMCKVSGPRWWKGFARGGTAEQRAALNALMNGGPMVVAN